MVALLPLRWHGHHVDVCAVLEDHQVRWIARDVLEAVTGDPGDFGDQPGHGTSTTAEHLTASAYPYDFIRGFVEHDGAIGQELLRFMAASENAIAAMGRQHLVRYATSPAQYDGPLYPVARAAQIIAGNTALAIGEQLLFQWLLQAGWIQQRGSEYVPAEASLLAGHLAVVPRRLPNTSDAYPQVVITETGLAQLHQLLGGTNQIVLEQEHA